MDKELRKYQNTLVVSGTGVLLFGAWSVAKAVLFFTLVPIFADALLELGLEDALTEKVLMALVWSLVVINLAAELLMRTYIGLCAIAEGKGRKKGYGYLLLAGFLVIQYLLMLLQGIGTAQLIADSLLDTVVTLILDLTSLYTMLEMIVSSVRVKRHRKALP